MGWVMMSERDLHRIEVLAQVDDGRLTVANHSCSSARRDIPALQKQ